MTIVLRRILGIRSTWRVFREVLSEPVSRRAIKSIRLGDRVIAELEAIERRKR